MVRWDETTHHEGRNHGRNFLVSVTLKTEEWKSFRISTHDDGEVEIRKARDFFLCSVIR